MPFTSISRRVEMGVKGINLLRSISVENKMKEVSVMQSEESHEPLSPKQQTRATTILVVEDDEDTRELIGLLISTLPAYHYCLVSDASQAIHFTQGVKPDLFILDYRLPGMNGLELYDQLHATPGL